MHPMCSKPHMTSFTLISGNEVQNFPTREIVFCMKLGNCNALSKDKHPSFTSAYKNGGPILWRG